MARQGGEKTMFYRTVGAIVLSASLVLSIPTVHAVADKLNGQLVLVAELEIDPAQLDAYKAAVRENGETAVRIEPGCLAYNIAFEKDNPGHIRILEVYADADAFKAHLESAHFKKYAAATKNMVKSRKRIDSVPIILAVKEVINPFRVYRLGAAESPPPGAPTRQSSETRTGAEIVEKIGHFCEGWRMPEIDKPTVLLWGAAAI
jgi:quinol monooxygenase YgiN